MTGQENPFYEHYDRILDICQEYDVTMSLGDACRPGYIEDASDISQIEELVTLGELTRRAWEKNVQVIIEGPGHMPLDQIEANMKIQQMICKGAPFYVLEPLVTDVAPGYDHITAEHLRLPDVNDVREGIIASKIAAHAADIAKGVKGTKDWDRQMSTARKNLDWEGMFDLAIDSEKARAYRASAKPEQVRIYKTVQEKSHESKCEENRNQRHAGGIDRVIIQFLNSHRSIQMFSDSASGQCNRCRVFRAGLRRRHGILHLSDSQSDGNRKSAGISGQHGWRMAGGVFIPA